LIESVLEENRDSLKENKAFVEKTMHFLVAKFDNLKKGSFQVAKNMVLILHDVLEGTKEGGLGLEFNKNETETLTQLNSLVNQNRACRDSVLEIHNLFLGRCIELVSAYVESVGEKEKDIAQATFEKVSEFCSAYEIPALGFPRPVI